MLKFFRPEVNNNENLHTKSSQGDGWINNSLSLFVKFVVNEKRSTSLSQCVQQLYKWLHREREIYIYRLMQCQYLPLQKITIHFLLLKWKPCNTDDRKANINLISRHMSWLLRRNYKQSLPAVPSKVTCHLIYTLGVILLYWKIYNCCWNQWEMIVSVYAHTHARTRAHARTHTHTHAHNIIRNFSQCTGLGTKHKMNE